MRPGGGREAKFTSLDSYEYVNLREQRFIHAHVTISSDGLATYQVCNANYYKIWTNAKFHTRTCLYLTPSNIYKDQNA